jgi:hypothetical protein
MAPMGSTKGKVNARAKMPTSVINRRLLFNWYHIQGFILEHNSGLIRISNVCGVKGDSKRDLVYDTIFVNPVTTCHISQFQKIWQNPRSRSSPFREWWAAFRSSMGQMFGKTHNQMNHWRWDNVHAFADEANRSNPHKSSSGKVKRTSERFSWYSSDDLRAKIEPPSSGQSKQGDFLAVRPQNCDEIMDEDGDDDNWADPGAPSHGMSRPGDGNDNAEGENEEVMQVGEKATGKGNGTKYGKWKGHATEDGKRKGKGQGNRTGKGKCII